MDAHNEQYRFGSARFAQSYELRRAGLFNQTPNALLVGFQGNKPIWYDQPGGVLLTAGARGGKLTTILGYNACHSIHAGTMVILDMKGELAAISRDLTPDQKFAAYWNPAGLHELPQHRVNPVDYIRADSPSLVSDVKVFCENMIVASGSSQGKYFEGRAREFLEAIILTLVRQKGVLTLPDIYEVINLIPTANDAWLDFAFEMNQSGFAISVRVEEEIAASRDNPTNGFQGILGEIFKAFACLSDPILLRSVSPPFDLSMSQLVEDQQRWQFYMMPPAEFIDAWAPVIKAMFIAGMIYKARAPHTPQQTWIIDECAQLGEFPLVPKLYTYGAGIGVRPLCVFQSTRQMNALGPSAETIITSSAALRSYFAIRDLESATSISKMLGTQTLEFDNEVQQARARHAKHKAVQAFLSGGDPIQAGMEYAHHKQEAALRSKQARALRTPDEVLGLADNKQFLFLDGLQPIFADRKAYYEQSFMAGRFHPNPYHPPRERVRVKNWRGHTWRPVIKARVSAQHRHYPQYKDGTWSYIGS